MKIIYKKVTEKKPFCSICNEQLVGNGSVMYPYKCSCGEWQFNGYNNKYELK